MGNEINSAQELMLQLIETSSCEDFDGPSVVASLRERTDLWQAIASLPSGPRLLHLRDLPRGFWHADVLYILAAKGREDALHDFVYSLDCWQSMGWLASEDAEEMLGVHGPGQAAQFHTVLWAALY